MLDRLKTLPLTILLTILIWMYAESQSNPMTRIETVTLEDVPVLVSGPPDTLARYQVVLESTRVQVTLTGPADKINPIREHPNKSGVVAYLDVPTQDTLGNSSSSGEHSSSLRFEVPPGTTVSTGADVGFRLVANKEPVP